MFNLRILAKGLTAILVLATLLVSPLPEIIGMIPASLRQKKGGGGGGGEREGGSNRNRETYRQTEAHRQRDIQRDLGISREKDRLTRRQ